MAHDFRRQSRRMALCGVLAALAVVLLSFGALIPFSTFCCPILAMLCMIPVVEEYGRKSALLFYGAVSVLALLLAPDKEVALLFTFLGMIFNFQMGYVTVLISHICFCVPLVVLNVMPRLRHMDRSVYDAARDLGCNEWQAFFKVVIHELMPGIVSGLLISFTYSLDDFIITHFTQGAKFQNLSTEIYAMLRRKIPPTINALSTLLFVAIIVIMVIINIRDRHEEKVKNEKV